jgi:hypothetical protein
MSVTGVPVAALSLALDLLGRPGFLGVQAVGFALLAAALVLARFRPGPLCLWLDFLGAALVTIDAAATHKWLLLVAAAVWTSVALHALVNWARGRTSALTVRTPRTADRPASAEPLEPPERAEHA